MGQPFIHEGLLRTIFEARIIRETTVGRLPATIPEVSGTAYLTGLHHFVVTPEDPLFQGFLLQISGRPKRPELVGSRPARSSGAAGRP